MIRIGLLIGAVCAAVSLATGCESNPPDIVEVDLTVYELTDRERNTTYEVLSLFVSAGDLDGVEDLDRLYLIHDDAELFWATHGDAWLQVVADGDTWIGEPRLAMPDRGPFPDGTYRVVLVDAAGESTERELVMAPGRTSPPPAAVVLSGSRAQIAGNGEHELWLLGADGLAGVATLEGGGEIDLAELTAGSRLGSRYDLYVVTRTADHRSQAMIGPFGWSVAPAPGSRNAQGSRN